MTVPAEQVSPYLRRLLPSRAVANRYGVHLRSVGRWVVRRGDSATRSDDQQ